MKRGFLKTEIGILEIIAEGKFITQVRFVEKTLKKEDLSAVIANCIDQLKEYLQGSRKSFDVPYQLNGSEFQKKVLKEVSQIPYGKCKTYAELADSIGDKKAAIAVGGANANNPLLILIPCHRVVGSDYSLKGYAGGLARKKELLRLEGVIGQLELW